MKLVYGEERFLVKREISRFKKAAKENGLEVLVSDSCSQDVINMASGGFMDYAVLIQLDGIDQIPQLFLEDAVNPVMAVLQKTPTEAQLKKLQEGIEPVRFDRLTPEEARRFVAAYATRAGRRITETACDELISRTGYGDDPNVGLTYLFNELEKLVSFDEDITADLVEGYVSKSAVYDTFELADAIHTKDLQKVWDFMENFFAKASNPSAFQSEALGVIALLGQNYRVAYKATYCKYPKKELNVYRLPISMTREKALAGMKECASADEAVKSGSNVRSVLTQLFNSLLAL